MQENFGDREKMFLPGKRLRFCFCCFAFHPPSLVAK